MDDFSFRIKATKTMTTLMYVGDFRLKVQADVKSNIVVKWMYMDEFSFKANINTKTMTMLMYVGDFRLKVQADVKSKTVITSTCIDDSRLKGSG